MSLKLSSLAASRSLVAAAFITALLPKEAIAGEDPVSQTQSAHTARIVVEFLAGAVVGLAAHEGAHLLSDVMFDADPGIKKVTYGGIPFFAITHTASLSPHREFTIASAGFWAQHAGSEWLLSRRPCLRFQHAPFAKGLLAFNVLTSIGYSAAAVSRTGPHERDTRSMAVSSGVNEQWIGLMILTPAVLDAYRYFQPEARWAVWSSRIAKVGLVLLVLK